jgi:hypothetical protein
MQTVSWQMLMSSQLTTMAHHAKKNVVMWMSFFAVLS